MEEEEAEEEYRDLFSIKRFTLRPIFSLFALDVGIVCSGGECAMIMRCGGGFWQGVRKRVRKLWSGFDVSCRADPKPRPGRPAARTPRKHL